MASEQLGLFSHEILGLVGRTGAGPHDLLRLAQRGRMLAWEPPNRMVFTWEISNDCGNEVEVRFSAEGDATRVELEHRGWESGGDDTWRNYDKGWGFVLGRLEAANA